MLRKMVVSQPISRAIGAFRLPRETLLDLRAHVHEDIPRKYENSKQVRMADDRLYICRYAATDKSGTGHIFTFAIDDTTSADYLMVDQIGHRTI